ncbi:expressed unknown protein [Seminavis robusta]|uniref:Uncharacterized protein n=1 Tax=Seminavis robusta TaxID=568900 RepID=A0A9N8DMW4_9STRA|nr:expressed unknown protein [Seminavis robusta]|eukprot:Sro143_g066580.1 n/a (176) ;mRNA; f:43965-44492
MIRSCRIPPILNRICDDVIHTSLLVTADGELLGASTKRSSSSLFGPPPDGNTTTTTTPNNNINNSTINTSGAIENLGTLIADIAVDYHRLGEEYAGIDQGATTRSNNNSNSNKSQLQCLLMELELGLVAVSTCGSFDCLVIAIASPTAPLGLVKARIQTLALYVQEALSPLAENT